MFQKMFRNSCQEQGEVLWLKHSHRKRRRQRGTTISIDVDNLGFVVQIIEWWSKKKSMKRNVTSHSFAPLREKYSWSKCNFEDLSVDSDKKSVKFAITLWPIDTEATDTQNTKMYSRQE